MAYYAIDDFREWLTILHEIKKNRIYQKTYITSRVEESKKHRLIIKNEHLPS